MAFWQWRKKRTREIARDGEEGKGIPGSLLPPSLAKPLTRSLLSGNASGREKRNEGQTEREREREGINNTIEGGAARARAAFAVASLPIPPAASLSPSLAPSSSLTVSHVTAAVDTASWSAAAPRCSLIHANPLDPSRPHAIGAVVATFT